MSEDKEGEGFVIKDKRASQKSDDEIKSADEASESKEQAEEPQGEGEQEMPPFELNYSTFVLSLTSSAFYHLGDIADPTTGKKEENLPAVKQTIDILLILQAKTKGNLDSDETKLMEQIIYELQMKYVAKTKK